MGAILVKGTNKHGCGGVIGGTEPCPIFNNVKKWLQNIRLPRLWDAYGIKYKVLGRTSAGTPRLVKAHEALVLLQSGLLSLLANLTGPTPEEQARRAGFGGLAGNVTELSRHLYATKNATTDLPKLQKLADDTMLAMETKASYKMLTLATHTVTHRTRQIGRDGPGAEWSMFGGFG